MSDLKEIIKLMESGKGVPFISPDLIKVLGIDEMYKKQGALEELEQQIKKFEIVKKLLNDDIENIGNLNIVKNSNKLWFLTGEINIVGNQIKKLNNRIKELEGEKTNE